MKNKLLGHVLAVITVIIWGTTFISTKVLLKSFGPVEILLLRFVLGYIVLFLMKPGILKTESFKQEFYYMLAGSMGVSLYYFLENTGLSYTYASNAGVIISAAPFFTAVLAHIVNKHEDPFKWNFFVGFVVALAGIFIISFNGAKLELNPIGDILIVGAALCWAVYSVCLKKIYTFGHNLIQSTRRLFAWGLLFMIIGACFTGLEIEVKDVIEPVNLLNLLFLGVGACAICFLIWNYASKIIGPVSANFYIYLTPVVTLIASALVLAEPITPLLLVGTVLTLAGLVISEWKGK